MRRQRQAPDQRSAQCKAGWGVDEWCKNVDFSRTFFYSLPRHLQPFSVRIGSKKRVITESPQSYLARMAAAQDKAAA
jgi:hypothetical protein